VIVALVVAFVVVFVVVSSRVAAGSPPTAVASAPGAEGVPALLSWRACGDGFQCSVLPVPLDDADPGGATINLAVVKRPARDGAERIGSLVVDPGGPGLSGITYLRGAADTLPGAVQDRFDLVSFDPRGVGQSGSIDCEGTLDPLFDQAFSPSGAGQRAALVQAFRQLAAACAARNPVLLAHVSTEETARDLDRLRASLGDHKLSFLGFSYGTYLGAQYASTYPDRVRAFVLDGAIDPTLDATTSVLQQVKGFEHSLDDFLADCSAHPGCAFHHHGDAGAAYDALRARAARAPLPARDGEGRRLDQTRLDAAVLEELYVGRPEWPSLATALAHADDGDASTLLDVADAFVGRKSSGRDDGALEAFWAISCLDGPVVGDVAATQKVEADARRIAPRLGPFIVNNSLACSVWPVAPRPSRGRLTAAGAAPILVVGTTQDPATPLVQARTLAHLLDRSALLVVAGERHTAYASGNDCVDAIVDRYLLTRAVPRPGTRC
jgi:pimeloyl-ACP methyl ester carboxylesterase